MPTPDEYAYVDGGPEFAAQHSLAFSSLTNAGVSASLGPLGREYPLAAGGAGYFRLDVVRNHIDAGRLHLVPGAPVFMYPAYAFYAESADINLLAPALAGLREAVGFHAQTGGSGKEVRRGRSRPRAS